MRKKGKQGIGLSIFGVLLSILLVAEYSMPLFAQGAFVFAEGEESNQVAESVQDAKAGDSDEGSGSTPGLPQDGDSGSTSGDSEEESAEGGEAGSDIVTPEGEEIIPEGGEINPEEEIGSSEGEEVSTPEGETDPEGDVSDGSDPQEGDTSEEIPSEIPEENVELKPVAPIEIAVEGKELRKPAADYNPEDFDAAASGVPITIVKSTSNVIRKNALNASLEPEVDPQAPRFFIINDEFNKAPKDQQVTLVTEEKNPREHTYVLIGGQKLDLKDNGLETLTGSIAHNSRVKLSLVYQLKGGNVRAQDFVVYNLPNNLVWENKSGAIRDRSDPYGEPVGAYTISNNKIIVQYSEKFLKENGMIDTRINVDGRAVLSGDGDSGEETYEFDGIGTIEDVKIERKAQLQIEKNVQADKIIVNNEDGDFSKTTIDVYYLVEMDVAGDEGGTITDINVQDSLSSIIGATSKVLDAKFIPDSFSFGTAFGNDDYRDRIKNLNVGNTGYSFEVDKWTKEDGKLYISYGVRVVPQLAPYAGADEKKANGEIVLHNDLTSQVGENPGPSAEDDFVYKNGMVDKSGTPVADESYMASWTATFNDYAPIAGADLGMSLIKDTLLQPSDPNDPSSPKVLKQDIEPIDVGAMINGQLNPDNWNLEKMSIMVYDGVDGKYQSGHEAGEQDFAKMTDKDGNATITDKKSFALAFFKDGGVKVPTTSKYIIKYRTRLFPELEPTIGDLSSVKLENDASNGPDILPEGGSTNSGVGVGPAKPTLAKNYKPVDGAPGKAKWEITLEIKDPKVQTVENTIYDYISRGHEIIEDSPIEFFIDDEKVGEIPWNAAAVVSKRQNDYIDNGDTKPTKTETDTEGNSKTVYDDSFQENFKFNVVEAIKYLGDVPNSEYIINNSASSTSGEGLTKHKYKIAYQTKLSMSSFEGAEVSGTSFTYKNNAFIVLPDNTVNEKNASTTRNLISKYDLDDNKALYEAATGKKLEDLAFQEIPWYMTAMVFEDELVLTDAYRKEYSTDGDMSFVDGSMVVYQTTSDDYAKADFDWNADAKKVDSSQYTLEKTYFENGNESGFKLSFKSRALDLEENNRVIVFFVTRGGEDYDNNIALNYVNTVTPNYASEGNPVAMDRTARYYEILNKKALPDNPDDPLIIQYTVDVNNSGLDIDSKSDVLELKDTLKQYLIYIAGTMQFFEVKTVNGEEILTEYKNGEGVYSIDAHENNVLKMTIPDETHVRLVYSCEIAYPKEDGEYAINEVSLKANKNYQSSSQTLIKIIEHDAIAGGQNFYIRVFKFDEDEPTNPLPGAYFRISAYNIKTDDDGVRRLEFVENTTNPIEDVTDENGEFVFTGKHDLVYRVEEIRSPEGYAVSNLVEHFCFTGYRPAEEFQGIVDENGEEIKPYINLVEDVSEFRFVVGNKKKNTAVKLIKQNQHNEKLEGAGFELYRVDENGEDTVTVDGTKIKAVKSQDKLVTDENGEMPLSYLEAGEYYLVETEAPGMHLLMEEPIHFTYDGETKYEFDENDAIISYEEADEDSNYNELTVQNERSDNIDLPVTKIWDDNDDATKRRPDVITILLYREYDGARTLEETVEVKGRGNKWSHTFKDLPTVISGKPVTYEIEEEVVSWYVTEIKASEEGNDVTVTNVNRPWFPEIPYTGSDYGKLTLLKTVSGTASSNEKYEVKITMTFPDGRTYEETRTIAPDKEELIDYIQPGTTVEIEELKAEKYTVTYKVDEKAVDKVKVKMKSNGDNHVTINNHIDEKGKKSGAKTGDDSNPTLYILAVTIALAGVVAISRLRRDM